MSSARTAPLADPQRKPSDPAASLGAWVELARPFTLLAPALGIASAAAAAIGAVARGVVPPLGTGAVAARVVVAMLVAATLNAASNALNQVTDLDADRINKPARPVPSGRISARAALGAALAAYAAAIAGAAWVGGACLGAVLGGAACTIAYSAPPLRFKRFGWLANATIAASRGLLLTVAGWSSVARVGCVDPWWIGATMALFLLGAASTKDFADIEGDRAAGCLTLPVRHGVPGTIRRIRAAFVWPFLLLPLGAVTGALAGNPWILAVAGVGLAGLGRSIVAQLEREPLRIDSSGNHVTWRRMYLAMLATQVAVAVAYLWPAAHGF